MTSEHKHSRLTIYSALLILGVVPEPTGQVASPGEAGGELHHAPGHPILPVLLQPLTHQLPGLQSAAGPLARYPHHHLHLPAVAPRLHRRSPGSTGQLHPSSPYVHALLPADLLPQLPGTGTQPPPAPHRLHVSPGLPVFGLHGQAGAGGVGPTELQYRLAEDEGQGTHPVHWEDVVMVPWMSMRNIGSSEGYTDLSVSPLHAVLMLLCEGGSYMHWRGHFAQ